MPFLTGDLDDVLSRLVRARHLKDSHEPFVAAKGDAWMDLSESARSVAAACPGLGAGLAALRAALRRHRERRRS